VKPPILPQASARALNAVPGPRAVILGELPAPTERERRLAQSAEAKRRKVNARLERTARLLWPAPPEVRGRAERVLVYRVGMVGDVLASLPALAAIRRAHPDAELTFLSSPGPDGAPGAAELLADSPAVDRLWIYRAGEVTGTRARLALAKELRAVGFDRLYVLPQELTSPGTEWRNLAFFKLAGVGYARGFQVANARFVGGEAAQAHLGGAHLERDADGQYAFESESLRLRRIAIEAGADPQSGGQPLGESLDAEANADSLRAYYALDRGPLLCLAPGSKSELKQWPVERFAQLAAEWVAGGGTAAVLGAPSEFELGERLIELSDAPVANLCGESDLLTSAELLRGAAGLLSNDTGTMHLGAAVGCPTVAVFSGLDRPGVWDPAGEDWTRLRAATGCSPCLAESCSEQLACLRGVGVDAVRASLAERLGRWPNTLETGPDQDRERLPRAA
jgi:ADP-heptose:LPS heptosyltransferase